MSFWPTQEHWSVQIPLHSPHRRMQALAETGVVALADFDVEIPSAEWLSLEYMDWKSGGDTNFAPLASADGELDCRGFWDKGKTDKGALWTSNATISPTLRAYVDDVGANFGRVRVIKLEPQTREQAIPLDPPRRQQPVQPRRRGLGGALVAGADRQPRQLHAADGQRSRRLARSRHRDPRAVAPRLAFRRRHAAAVARRGAHRRRAALRPDHQLRDRPTLEHWVDANLPVPATR